MEPDLGTEKSLLENPKCLFFSIKIRAEDPDPLVSGILDPDPSCLSTDPVAS